MPQGQPITQDKLTSYQQAYLSHPLRPVTGRAIARCGLNEASFENDALRQIRPVFSHQIDTMPVTNQKKSGRCWLFAALNLLREDIAKQLDLEPFELSQNYLTFWDKLEKGNYFLDSVLETLDEPTDSRLFCWLMASYQDGGQWDMFVNLVDKYGLVPKQAMPETYHSEATAVLNQVVTALLRKSARQLRQLSEAGAAKAALLDAKDSMVSDLYGLLCQCLGQPPERFDWDYTDKNQTVHSQTDLTPQLFLERFVSLPFREAVSVIHAPTRDKPFERTFTVRFLNNMSGGRPVRYLNLPMPQVKELVLQQLKDGFPVWFGCDVAPGADRDQGAWVQNLHAYAQSLDLDVSLSKADRLDYRQSAMNHAMVLTGVHLKDGRPVRWKIQNSWGDEPGAKGYFTADDAWFDENVYQAVINKNILSDQQKKALDQADLVLDPWDPMGSLA